MPTSLIFVLKCSFQALCFCVFIWQFSDTTVTYLQYETVTKYEYTFIQEMPSITFCLPRLFPVMYIEGLFAKYKRQSMVNDTFVQEFRQFYTRNNFNKCALFGACNIEANLKETIPYFNNSFLVATVGLEIKVFNSWRRGNDYLTHSGLHLRFNESSNFAEFLRYDFSHCITLFTKYDTSGFRALNETGVAPTLSSKSSQFHLFLYDLFYFNDTVYFELDSRDMIPNFEFMSSITIFNTAFDVTFYQTKVVSLPPPFKTGCRHYATGERLAEQSRDDCMAKCILRRFVKLNNVEAYASYLSIMSLTNSSPNNFLISSQLFDGKNNNSLPPLTNGTDFLNQTKFEDLFEKNCERNCPVDCVTTRYHLESKPARNYLRFLTSVKQNELVFHFQHDRKDDVHLVHSALMDFFSYMGMVGGLVGMWVGFSFVDLPDKINHFISIIFSRNQVQRSNRSKRHSITSQRHAFSGVPLSDNLQKTTFKKYFFGLVVVLVINFTLIYSIILYLLCEK